MSLERRKVTGGAWETVEGSENDGSPSSRVLGPYVFNYDDDGLEDGVVFYTPTIGELLMDAWIEVVEAFNGTTPHGEIGTFVGTSGGLFGRTDTPPDLSEAISEPQGAGFAFHAAGDVVNPELVVAAGSSGARVATGRFTATNPLKFVVSQTGGNNGAAVGGTAGIAHVYIVIATPEAP